MEAVKQDKNAICHVKDEKLRKIIEC